MLVLSFSPGFEELIFHPHSGPIFFSELPDLTQSAMVKHFLKIDKKKYVFKGELNNLILLSLDSLKKN